jgi:ribosomal protein L11
MTKGIMTTSTEAPPIVEATVTATEMKSDMKFADIIQTVIASMDSDKTAVVNQPGNTWKFQYGTVEVIVNITGEAPTDTFTVLSTVLSFPVKDEAKLLRLLLEKNASETFEARFAIQNDQVIVVAARSVEDLSAAEISRIITIVAAIADSNDEALKAQFSV